MQYNFILIRTNKGSKYARKILNSVKWLNRYKYSQYQFIVADYTIEEFLAQGGSYGFRQIYGVNNTIIHARCANPRTSWTEELRDLEERGYKVVNSVDCIELTSNKLACSLHLMGKVAHPKSWEFRKNMTVIEFDNMIHDIQNKLAFPEFIIAKPLTSLEQGANVRKINLHEL